MALYFACQGTGEMVWPVVANLSRITIAVCGSLLALDVLGWGVRGLFTFVALGIVVVLRRARLLDDAAGMASAVALALDRNTDLQSDVAAMNQGERR